MISLIKFDAAKCDIAMCCNYKSLCINLSKNRSFYYCTETFLQQKHDILARSNIKQLGTFKVRPSARIVLPVKNNGTKKFWVFCTRTPSQGCTPQQLNLQKLFYFPDFLHFYQEPLYGKVAALMDEIWSGLDSTKKNCFNATYELLEISVIFASKQSCECHWDNSRKISFCQLITFLLFLAVRKKNVNRQKR